MGMCDCGSQNRAGHNPHSSNCSVYDRPIGCILAQRLTTALMGLGIPYAQIADIVYRELRDITNEQDSGDWLEMPNGQAYYRR